MATEVVMPQMGESIAEGTITKWLKNVGDHVDRDEPLFEISTDKVDAEIPSPVAGVVSEIRVKEGDKGTRKAALLVRLSHASPDLVSVHFATSSGSAAARSDFKPVKRTVAFLPGQRKLVVTVLVVGDLRNEQSERFFANLSKITGALRADAKGAVKIVDDD